MLKTAAQIACACRSVPDAHSAQKGLTKHTQDPALGENRYFGHGWAPTFAQVDGSDLLAVSPEPGRCAPVFLPSRDVAPESCGFAARTRRSLPSRDVVPDGRHNVPTWEGLWLLMMGGGSPKTGRCAWGASIASA